MQINNGKQLAKAINELQTKKAIEEDKIIKDLYIAKQYFDPVYHVNSLLPRKVPLREALNATIAESIFGAATYGFKARPKDSFLKRAKNNFLRKAALRVLDKNSNKIKAVGLAILKNIFT